MKRTFSILLSLALLLAVLPACARTAAEPDTPAKEPEVLTAARELAETVLPASARAETLEVERLNADEDADRLAAYIEAVCGLTGEQWEDAAVIRGMGASAFEIVVLRLEDEEAAENTKAVLTDYLAVREGAFTGYAPDEAEMASNGRVRREGQYVGLFICPDPAGAEDMFSAACRGEELPALPEPASGPEPSPDPEPLVLPLRDILHRLLLEAACPEWRSVEKFWTGDDSNYVSAYWAPDDGNEWTPGGKTQFEFNADGEPIAVVKSSWEYGVTIFQMESSEAAENQTAYNKLGLEEQEEQYRQEGDEIKAELMANGQAFSCGCYAVTIISDHTEDAVRLFPRIVNDPDTNGYFTRYIEGLQPAAVTDPDPDYPDRVRFNPPGEEDMSIYDTSAILAAWEAGDPNRLSGDDREIYDAAAAVLAEITRDGMSDLEKETAAYRWLVNNVDYDWSHMDALEETDRRSYGPYGGLVDRAAVCLGYAASFQLLMDMSGVECITIVGAAFNSTGDHAWNMVRLGGEWYCVDATWDANAREQFHEEREWRYFNLTSDEMAKDHQWDYANTPEATAADRGGAA
ncbi:MAG: DUF4358 domain-containing protein [Oscillibacter sp.]|nr:DUF4358 domain-containing protein [Oscillibacter sp.]